MRKIVIEIPNKLTVTDLDIQVSLEKNKESKDNSCTVRISNLSNYNLLDIGDRVFVKAGDVETLDLDVPIVFVGSIVSLSEKGIVDKITNIGLVEDGDLLSGYKHFTIQKNSTLNEAIKSVLDTVNADFIPIDFTRRYNIQFVLFGSVGDVLTELLLDTGYEWKLSSGTIHFIKDGDITSTGVEASRNFINLPKSSIKEDTKNQETVKTLEFTTILDPRIDFPRVKVKSGEIDSVFEIDKIKHVMANRKDSNWETTVVCLT